MIIDAWPRRFAEDALRSYAEAIIAGVGASPEAAGTVAASLIEADRRGVHTHGLVRLPSYCADARAGRIVVEAVPQLVQEHGPTAVFDGCGAFGAVTGTVSMDAAISRAEQHGVGFVTARGCNHFGTAAFYSLRAVARDLVGIAATSTPAVMAPWGGAEARLGNNPLSVAAPMPDGEPPFVLDFAQSAVSRGRIKLAELNGESIPLGEGRALDVITPAFKMLNTFWAYDAELLMCAHHSAMFRFEDGLCIDGPCQGAALTPVAIRIEQRQIFNNDWRREA